MRELTPLDFNDVGVEVAALHQALEILDLDGDIGEDEFKEQRYGEGTAAAVLRLRAQLGMPDLGSVRFDEHCAARVNAILAERGYLDQQHEQDTAQRDQVQSSARERWKQIEVPGALAADDSPLTAVSRRSDHMEVWWLGRTDPLVQGAYRYIDSADDWKSYTIPRQLLKAMPRSAIAAVSRDDPFMEVWWIGAGFGDDVPVLGAYWPKPNEPHKGDWAPYRLSSPAFEKYASGSSGMVAVSRRSKFMEVWWIGPDGRVHGAWWWEDDPVSDPNQRWHPYPVPGADDAAFGGGVAAVSRNSACMAVVWIGNEGQVRGASWEQDVHDWKPYDDAVAPKRSAAQSHSIVAISRTSETIDVLWVGEEGEVRSATWTDGVGWAQPELVADKFSASIGGIAALAHTATTMEVWWVTRQGAVKGKTWTQGAGWQTVAESVAADGNASTEGGIAATARTDTTTQLWWVKTGGAIAFAERTEASETIWEVHGVIRKSGQPYPDPLRVNAFDANHIDLGEATAVDGTYRIEYQPPQPVGKSHPDGGPADFTLIVAAYTPDGAQIVRSEPKPRPNRIERIDLDATDAAAPKTVRGTIVDARGRPVSGVLVKVFDRDIGTARELLGQMTTGADGAFTVQYQTDAFKYHDVETIGADGKIQPLTADVVFELSRGRPLTFRVERLSVGAADIITTDLPVPDEELVLGIVARDDELVRITAREVAGTPGKSEYTRVIEALTQIADAAKIADFDETTHRDVTFAARETGLDHAHIDAMVAAHKLRKVLGDSVQPQPCYGVVRHGGARTANAVAASAVSELATALESAISQGTIDALESPGDVAAALHRAAVAVALKPDDPANYNVTTPLNYAIEQPDTQARVLAVLTNPPPGTEDVWKHIEDTFQEVNVERLQYALQLGSLLSSQINNNKALFDKIIAKVPNATTMGALVRQLDDRTLIKAINDVKAVPDDSLDTETAEQARERLARSLRRLMDAAHPTAAVARTFAEINSAKDKLVNKPTTAVLDMLVERNIDLATANLTQVIADDATILANLADDGQRAKALDDTLRAQRLFRISGDAADLKLIASATDGTGNPLFAGAVDIARLGKAAFLAHVEPSTAGEVAALDQIHRRAQTFADTLANLAIAEHQDNRPDQIRSAASGLQPTEPAQQVLQARTTTWEQIFGSEEQCECDECRSVIGPAAYLVDLFEFLDKRCEPDDHGITLLDRLIGHPTKKDEHGNDLKGLRPDLAHIKLTCHNVNTTLPFIDVINQILESVIATNDIELAELDPDVTSAQLGASPIRIIKAAYDELAKAVYPIGLPYDRLLDTTRTWMRQAGVDRAEALRTFRQPRDGDQPRDVIAAETLGLYRRDWEIITGAGLGGGDPQDAVPTVEALYGVDTIGDLTAAYADVVLKALSITFERLVEVLRTNFIGGLVPDADDRGTDARILLTIAQLNTLRATNYQTTDPEILRALELGGITGEDVEKFDDAHLDDNPIVLDPSIECDPASVKLRHLNGDPLTDTEWLQIHRLVRLSARSGIRPADLDVALAAVGSPKALTPAALHNLYELARLRAVLSVDWRRAAAVVSAIGTQGRTNLYDELFINSGIAQVHPALRRGGELLKGNPVALETIASAIANVLRWEPEELAQLTAALNLAQVDLADVSTLHRIAVLARTLGMSPLHTHRLHAVLNPGPPHTPAPPSGPAATLQFVQRASRISNVPLAVPAIEALIDEPVNPPADDPVIVAAKAALDMLKTSLANEKTAKPEEAKKLVIDIVAKHFDIDLGSSKQLVAASTTLAELPFNPTDPDQLKAIEADLRRIARLAEVIRGLGTAAIFLLESLGHPPRPANALRKMFGPSSDEVRVVRLEVIDDISRFADLAGRLGRPKHLKEAVAKVLAAPASIQSAIAAWLEISEERAQAVVDGYGTPSQPLVPLEYLAGLADISRAATRFGIEPQQVVEALKEPVDKAAVDVLLTGVAKHYSSRSWLELSKQLADPIRERSRDALVAHLKYLKRNDGINDDNDLFAHYLVDVGRDSFVLTSPIQQATFAVQTFVQRCLLGMDKHVKPHQVNSDEWVVEGSYPVWASRMMTFLWPEQILNPAWRDDKSPAFVELENALRQSDVTEANARRALEQYLESMAVTSSLEICGTYRQDKFTGIDTQRFQAVLHIVGRTRTSPRRYFYRRLETYQHHEEWTDWEPISTDIEGIEQERGDGRTQESEMPLPVPGVHVLPVVWRGAVYLFWATFVRKVDTPSNPPAIDVAAQKVGGRFSKPYWEIKLNYTRRDPAGWTPKTQWPAIVETWLKGVNIYKVQPFLFAPETLVLHAKSVPEDDEALQISIGRRVSLAGPISNQVSTQLYYTFTSAGPHARVTSRQENTVPPLIARGDHPAFQGDVKGDFEAVSVTGDLKAVASSENPAGDRLFISPTATRITTLNQGYNGWGPLLLDLGDNVYYASPREGTTTIWVPRENNNGAASEPVYPFFRDTVINSVSQALPGPAVVDQAKGRQMAKIRFATPDELVAAVKSTAAQAIKARNPWVGSQALVAVTADLTVPSGGMSSREVVAANGPQGIVAEVNRDAKWLYVVPWAWGQWNWYRPKSIPAVDLLVVPFSNPFVNQYNLALRTGGLDALYNPALQNQTLQTPLTFKSRCKPDPLRVTAPDTETVEFDITSPCARQHWELFFHINALLQDLQRENKQLDAALITIRRIYDPLSPVTDPKDVWRFKPFREAKPLRVDDLLALLNKHPDDEERKKVEAQLEQMRLFPFQGHRIARLRPTAYKRWLVTEFVRLLIELTDRELRTFTPESVNRGFLPCLAAAAIMGPAPDRVRPRAAMAPRSYAQLRPLLDGSSNVLLSAETELGAQPVASVATAPAAGAVGNMARSAAIGYFGIPRNKKLHELWDLVDDRLYKLRRGMNLDGVRVQLPLFLPPIDPAVLAQAVASGVSLGDALQMLDAERPPYRYVVAHREAVAAAQNLITIGEALLAAYTQRDAESLARLTATHQKDLAKQVLDARAKAVQVADAELADAQQQREAHIQMWRHYRELLGVNLPEPGPGPDQSGYAKAQRQLNLVQSSSVNFAKLQVIPDIMKGVAFLTSPQAAAGLELIDAGAGGVTMAPGMMLAEEKQELESSFEAVKLSFDAALLETLAGALGLIPNFEGAVKPLGAGAAVHFGGAALAAAARAAAGNKNTAGGMHRFLAQVFGKQASLVLREREWIIALNQAAAHVHEIDKRIAVANLRIELAKAEQSTQVLALKQAEQIQTYLQTQKFTRFELFDQRINQLRGLFRRVADVGFGLLDEAQQLFREERPNDDATFTRLGPPATAEAELLSGHQLMASLQEMNRRFLATAHTGPQLTKHISLREINPEELNKLRENGEAHFKVDELWFDLDHPDHLDRRIVSVAVSIPCITGPMTGVGGKLSLTASWRRLKKTPTSLTPSTVTDTVALSSGRDDAGRFEIRPDDPLYNPFEGLGAISEWNIQLPKKLRKFNYRTISDVILTIRYTAEAGGASREGDWDDAFKALGQFGGKAVRMISVRHDRPDAWAAFLAGETLRVASPVDSLPHILRHRFGATLELELGGVQPVPAAKPADTNEWIDADAEDGDLVCDLGAVDPVTLDDVTVLAYFTVSGPG